MNLTNDDIAEGLKHQIDAGKVTELPRHYLGASQLGHSCARHLWFYFRWADKINYTHRNNRIFRAGDDSEVIIVNELKRIGVKVKGQQETIKHCEGYILGHSDGIISNVPGIEDLTILLEAKSAKDKSWNYFVKNGIQKQNKDYYCQAQVYMHKLKLPKALFVVLNKDTSELYFELIDYNKDDAESLLKRGEDVVYSSMPMKLISPDPSYYECNWCNFAGVCHENKPFNINCRTCSNIELYKGQWYCSKKKEFRTLEEQKQACESYDMMEV